MAKVTKAEVLFNKLTYLISVKTLEEYAEITALIPEMIESGANAETINNLMKVCLAGLFIKKYPNPKLVENSDEDTRGYWFNIRNDLVGEINKRQYHNSLVDGETVSERFVNALIKIRDKVTLN